MSRNFSLSVDRHIYVFCRLMTAALLDINSGTNERLIMFRSYFPELNPITGNWRSQPSSCPINVLYGLFLPSSASSSSAPLVSSSHSCFRASKAARTAAYNGNREANAASLMVLRRVIIDPTRLSASPSVTKHSAGS